jgi:hypothetical protein
MVAGALGPRISRRDESGIAVALFRDRIEANDALCYPLSNL